MKNTYILILIGLIMLGIVYADTEPKEKTEEETWKYKPIEICKFPVFMDVGHYVQLKECHKRKIELKQVDCEEIGKDHTSFPCYKGCETIQVKANFPAIFSASIKKNEGDDNLLKEVNLYWVNGINTIQGTGQWEELKLCLETLNAKIYRHNPDTIEIGEIIIQVRPPDDPNYNTPDDPNSNPKDETKDNKKQED